jgi:hypothetical protein
MKTLLEYIDVVVEETSPINIILAVAELMRKEADASRETAKTSIFVFLDKLNNAGLSIDYPGLKAYYDADPRLSNVIQQFNDREITFVGQGDEEEMPDTGAPVGEVPPEKKVNQMAKAALAKRESIGEAFKNSMGVQYETPFKAFEEAVMDFMPDTAQEIRDFAKKWAIRNRQPSGNVKIWAEKLIDTWRENEPDNEFIKEDEYAALDSFTNNLNLSPEEDAKIAAGPDTYEADEKLMAKLMDHFKDEMPYGTQKGRDGDPYEFIFQELDNMGLIKEGLDERKLDKAEKSKMKHYEKKIDKKDFIERYGKDRGEMVYYATITKMAKEHA